MPQDFMDFLERYEQRSRPNALEAIGSGMAGFAAPFLGQQWTNPYAKQKQSMNPIEMLLMKDMFAGKASERDITEASRKSFNEYSSNASDVLGALDKIEEYAKKLPAMKTGVIGQAKARFDVAKGEFAADKRFSEFSGVLSGELIPMARKLQEEKGPITEWDVARVEKGLGQKNLPFSQKQVIIQESRNKVGEQVLNKLSSAGWSVKDFATKYPALYSKVKGAKIRFNVEGKSYLIPFSEAEEFKSEMGL